MMFPSPLRATLAALVAYAVAYCAVAVSAAPAASAPPSLTIKASIQNVTAAGLRNLEVTTTITNVGEETLKLLNDPRGVFSSSPENAFTVTDSSGSHIPFGGALVGDDSRSAADPDHPAGFTVIAPGVSINITHDLSAAYNLIQSGAGDYSIQPSNLFTYVDADGTPKDFYATVEGINKVNLSRDLAAEKTAPKHKLWGKKITKPKKATGPKHGGKAAKFHSCPSHREIEILSIAKEAEKLIAKTYAYTSKKLGRKATPRYTIWYGAYDKTRMGKVKDHWKMMSRNPETRLSTLEYSCACDEREKKGTSTSINPSTHKMSVCEPFWDLDADEKVYTFIRQVSRLYSKDHPSNYAVGEAKCEKLARENPGNAIYNADNYKFFAWNKERSK